MTEKRWLIRTRSKQILGPASKEKIISLIEKESLDDEDELSSGNGYWFWVKERDLVEKYLYSSERQGFNPVTESESVLNSDDAVPIIKQEVKLEVPAPEAKKIEVSKEDSELVMPDDEDLEFPDVSFSSLEENNDEEMALDHTSVITLDQLSDKGTNLNDGNNLALDNHQDIADTEDEQLEATKEIKPLVEKTLAIKKETIIPNKKESKIDVKKKPVKKELQDKLEEGSEESSKKTNKKQGKKTRNDRYLFLLLIFICLLLFSVFYYYRTIINKPIPIIGIANVQAQSLTSLVKKKVQFS